MEAKAIADGRSISEWVSEHPWIIVAVVMALLIGVFLGASHERSPELASLIVGPAVGSFLAVGGGAWLATSQDRRRRSEAKKAIFPTLTDLRQSLEKAINGYAPYEASLYSGDGKHGETRVAADIAIAKLYESLLKIQQRLPNMKAQFDAYGSLGGYYYSDALSITDRSLARLHTHSSGQADLVPEKAERTVGSLIELWDETDKLVHSFVSSGRAHTRSSLLPEAVRTTPRFALALASAP